MYFLLPIRLTEALIFPLKRTAESFLGLSMLSAQAVTNEKIMDSEGGEEGGKGELRTK